MIRRLSWALVVVTIALGAGAASAQQPQPWTPPKRGAPWPAGMKPGGAKPAASASAAPATSAAAPPASASASAAAPPASAAPVAAPPATPSPADAEAAAKDEARKHFEKGLVLSDEEALDAALAEFLRSREIYPTRGATKNAALCLRRLKRFDEALDMYEELRALPNLPREDRELADREIAVLRGYVGAIEITGAEAGAAIVVDGRARGTTPLAKPLGLSAGTHLVRVFKQGFEAFEQRVTVASGQTQPVPVKLVALAQNGRLRVAEQTGKQLDVVVDGVVVGKTPWEGPLALGDHTVVLRGPGDLGTQPAAAPVRLNQVTPLTLLAEPLTTSLRVQPTPAGASVAVDGVAVGRGAWQGRLRAGAHKIEVAAEGFLPQVRDVKPAPGQAELVAVELERDPTSPLWSENRGHFYVEIEGAFGVAPTLGGDVAGGCSSGCATAPGIAPAGMGRVGYRFANGLLLGLEGGYLFVRQKVTGRATEAYPAGLAANPGVVDDVLALRGGLLGASAGLRLGSRFPVTLRLGAGAFLGALEDARAGAFTTVARGQRPAAAYSVDVKETASATSIYVAPEARIGVRVAKGLDLSFGVDARVLISVKQATWAPESGRFIAATDGLATFGADALAGRAVVVVSPSLGAKYEF